MTKTFSALLAAAQPHDGVWLADVPDDWSQGRSVFGGLQAALLLQAMRAQVPPELPLRTLQVTFMAPVPPGRVSTRARVLRQGKSTVHVLAEIFDGEAVLALATAVFGAARDSVVRLRPEQAPVDDSRALKFPYIPGVTPDFTRHFSVHWLQGKPPYMGNTETLQIVDIDMLDEGPASESQLLAIADFMPPVALSWLRKPAPGSSMTWMIEVLDHGFTSLPLNGWRVDASLTAAGEGYTSQSCMIWGPGGVPVALSRQSMVIFG